MDRRLAESGDVTLTKLPAAPIVAIRRTLEQQRQMDPHRRYTYLVLPGTLSLREALEIIAYKESLFEGLPQLVLIFISKFDPGEVRRDASLREQYFRAIKHNVIVNLAGATVVDNPGGISLRLVQETIGRAFDLDKIDLMPEQDTHLKSAPA